METKLETANTNKATEFIDKFGCEISKTSKCLRYYIKKTKKKPNKTKDYNSAIQYTYDFINYSYNKKKEKYNSPDTTAEEIVLITNELLNKFGELNKKHKYTFSLISSVIGLCEEISVKTKTVIKTLLWSGMKNLPLLFIYSIQ